MWSSRAWRAPIVADRDRGTVHLTSSKHPRDPRAGEEWCHSVIALVVDAETGAPTDGGGGDEYPDLVTAGQVITDYISHEL